MEEIVIIILWGLWLYTLFSDKKIIDKQDKLIDEILENQYGAIKNSTQVMKNCTEVIEKNVTFKKRVYGILNNAEKTKETYQETFEKIKKALSEY